MPSQSRWEGELIPDHSTRTESPDLVSGFGDMDMETCDDGVARREENRRRRRRMRR